MDKQITFGEWVTWLRKISGLTQEDLASQVGCSRATIRKIESGERRPSYQIAVLLADRLNVAASERNAFLSAARGVGALRRITPPDASPIDRKGFRLATPIPVAPTPLIGREQELDTLLSLLRDPQCRMITLTGPGGIGKSRLAMEVARLEDGEFSDGVAYIPLAPISSPEFIAPTIATQLQIDNYGSRDDWDNLTTGLRHKQILLVLDNAEHLLDGLNQIANLLESAPNLKILVTSRERLQLRGEWIFDIQGLPLPNSGMIDPYVNSCIQLFLQCARRADGRFTPKPEDLAAVIQICRLVEGLPLAIELAASWVPVLSCREIRDEIEACIDFLRTTTRDMPERHRSIRAVFDQSWKVLSDDEKEALKALSVFRGGFNRDMAYQVGGIRLETLSNLVSKSLVRHYDTERYDLHELVRQYSFFRLSENPANETALQDQHARFMLKWMHDQEIRLKGPQQSASIHEVSDNLENLRIAWRHAAQRHMAADLYPAMRAFYWFLEIRSWIREAIQTFELVVDALEKPCNCPEVSEEQQIQTLGRALQFLGYFSMRAGRQDGRMYLQRSIDLLHGKEFLEPLADAERDMGILHYLAGEFQSGESLLLHSQEYYTQVNDTWSAGTCDFHMGNSANIRADYPRAERYYWAALQKVTRIGDFFAQLRIRSFLVHPMFAQQKYAEAAHLANETLIMAREAGDRYSEAEALHSLGQIALAEGNLNVAATSLETSLSFFSEFEDVWSVAELENEIAQVLMLQNQPDHAWQAYLRALQAAERSQVIPHMLDAVAGMAEVLMSIGYSSQAFRIYTSIQNDIALNRKTRERILDKVSGWDQAQLINDLIKNDIPDSGVEGIVQFIRELTLPWSSEQGQQLSS